MSWFFSNAGEAVASEGFQGWGGGFVPIKLLLPSLFKLFFQLVNAVSQLRGPLEL